MKRIFIIFTIFAMGALNNVAFAANAQTKQIKDTVKKINQLSNKLSIGDSITIANDVIETKNVDDALKELKQLCIMKGFNNDIGQTYIHQTKGDDTTTYTCLIRGCKDTRQVPNADGTACVLRGIPEQAQAKSATPQANTNTNTTGGVVATYDKENDKSTVMATAQINQLTHTTDTGGTNTTPSIDEQTSSDNAESQNKTTTDKGAGKSKKSGPCVVKGAQHVLTAQYDEDGNCKVVKCSSNNYEIRENNCVETEEYKNKKAAKADEKEKTSRINDTAKQIEKAAKSLTLGKHVSVDNDIKNESKITAAKQKLEKACKALKDTTKHITETQLEETGTDGWTCVISKCYAHYKTNGNKDACEKDMADIKQHYVSKINDNGSAVVDSALGLTSAEMDDLKKELNAACANRTRFFNHSAEVYVDKSPSDNFWYRCYVKSCREENGIKYEVSENKLACVEPNAKPDQNAARLADFNTEYTRLRDIFIAAIEPAWRYASTNQEE